MYGLVPLKLVADVLYVIQTDSTNFARMSMLHIHGNINVFFLAMENRIKRSTMSVTGKLIEGPCTF